MSVDSAAPPRVLRADAQRNYDALLVAARETFAEKRSDASIEDIAKRAGVGIGTLYRHFPRRIDLVEAVYAADVDMLVAQAAAAAELDPWAGLESWLHAFVRYAETKRVLITELHEFFERNPDKRLEMRERLLAAAGTVLSRAQTAGVARGDISPEDLMHLVGGMCLASAVPPGQNERLLPVVLQGIRAGG